MPKNNSSKSYQVAAELELEIITHVSRNIDGEFKKQKLREFINDIKKLTNAKRGSKEKPKIPMKVKLTKVNKIHQVEFMNSEQANLHLKEKTKSHLEKIGELKSLNEMLRKRIDKNEKIIQALKNEPTNPEQGTSQF